MIKLLCFFKAKPGISVQQMREYYESTHVPLAYRLLPPFLGYRRNYPGERYQPSHIKTVSAMPDFDVMTEIWYEDEDYARMLEIIGDPEIARELAEDEANFLDRDSMMMMLVEEVGRGD